MDPLKAIRMAMMIAKNVGSTAGKPLMKAGGGSFSGNLMGINIRNSDVPYADHVVDGKKKFETRNTNSLKPYIGKRVAVVRTGQGPAQAIGEMTVGEPMVVDEKKFRELQPQHLVTEGSEFDIKPGGTKHLYPVIDPVRYDSPKSVGHGIIARAVHKKDGGSLSADDRQANLKKFMEGAHPAMFNEDGTPKVFYHGTQADFGHFRPSHRGAHFFSSDPEFAETDGSTVKGGDRPSGP